MELLRIFAVVSCDRQCAEQLFRPGFFGRVHSVFSRVINFWGPNEVLYSLACDALDNAPFTIRVVLPPNFRFDATGVMTGIPVMSGHGLLRFGTEFAVDAVKAEYWEAALPEFPSGSQCGKLAVNLEVLRRSIAFSGTEGGLKELCTGPGSWKASTLFSRELALRTGKLMTALETGDTELACFHGSSLLGLGIGQTPSGDDFLCGLLTVFHMPKAPFRKQHMEVSRCLVVEARKRTGAISCAMLTQAAGGRARETIVSSLTEIVAGEPGRVAAAVAQVLAIGSASGTDIAVGLLTGMEHGLQLLEKEAGGNGLGNKDCCKKECLL
jgi:hypothetical protein